MTVSGFGDLNAPNNGDFKVAGLISRRHGIPRTTEPTSISVKLEYGWIGSSALANPR
ncbi:MAG: hypothetical protein IPG04_17645 [Polyangiaceae bacterium]|nr:hypothetical protein [Polyangiaceae bacterium]